LRFQFAKGFARQTVRQGDTVAQQGENRFDRLVRGNAQRFASQLDQLGERLITKGLRQYRGVLQNLNKPSGGESLLLRGQLADVTRHGNELTQRAIAQQTDHDTARDCGSAVTAQHAERHLVVVSPI